MKAVLLITFTFKAFSRFNQSQNDLLFKRSKVNFCVQKGRYFCKPCEANTVPTKIATVI